jgi:uroporphyrinogen-III synthase
VDAITLTSSSAETNLTRRIVREDGDLAAVRQLPVACIGERTAETARAQGLRVVAVPDEHTLVGLVASLEEYFAHVALTQEQEGNDDLDRA